MHDSPRIKELNWGSLRVEGTEEVYKDAKLFPGGSREWDWTETRTHHHPGIQPEDVQELLDKGAQILVLASGHHQRLGIAPETLASLEKVGMTFHIAETEEAVELYNKLAEQSVAVGALIHSTC